MQTTLLVSSAIEILESAFLPLKCSVKSYDFDRKLRFKIFSSENISVLDCLELSSDLATNPSRLLWVIENTRKEIVDQKILLEQWSFPFDKV